MGSVARRRTAMVPLLIGVVLVLAVSQLMLPPLLTSRMEEALALSLQADAGVEVRLAAFPAVRLLLGYADRVEAEARGVHVGGLRVDRLRFEGTKVQVDPRALARRGTVELREAERLDASLWVSEAALDSFVKENVRLPSSSFTATVTEEHMRLHGEVGVLGQTWPVTVEGALEVVDGTRLDFIASRVSVDTVEVPRFLLEGVMRTEEFRVGVDLADLPVPLEVSRIRLEPGWLTVHAYSPLARLRSNR